MSIVNYLGAALVGALLPIATAAAQAVAVPVAASPAGAVSSRSGQTVEIDGLAEFSFNDGLFVSGYRVLATADTRFAGENITGLADIPLGFRIEAKGVVQPDGSIVAEEIEAKPRERSDAGRGVVTGALEQEGTWLSGGGSIFRAALQSTAPETRLPVADPQYERVKTILQRMVPGSLEDSLRLHIVNSPDWNARGLPNGSIAVAAGLLADMDDDEVAVVLGHELAHITHQHAQKTLADAERRKLLGELLADLIPEGGLAARVALSVGGAVALKAWQSGYSRSLETEADRVGLSYAAAGGFDVRKAPHVWERFQEKYGSEQALKNFIVGNHPRNVERVRNARVELDAFYPAYVPTAPPIQTAAISSTPAPAGPALALTSSGQQLASGSTPPVTGPAPTREITQGMTQAEVEALLGTPKEKLVFATADGQQTKWVFAHLTVTFTNGRVSAVGF